MNENIMMGATATPTSGGYDGSGINPYSNSSIERITTTGQPVEAGVDLQKKIITETKSLPKDIVEHPMESSATEVIVEETKIPYALLIGAAVLAFIFLKYKKK